MNRVDTSHIDPSSDKVAVVYLIDRFSRGAGTETQLEILIDNIDKSRFESYLVNLRPRGDDGPGVDRADYCLNVTKLSSLRALPALWKFVGFLRKHRVRILQLYYIDSNLFGVIAGRLAGIRNIIVNRRDMGWWYSTPALPWANRVNRFARYCIANSLAVKQIVMKTEPFGDKQIRVIHNGLDYVKPACSPTLTKQDFGIPESAPVVGIVANLKPIKRIDMFLRIAGKLENTATHFLIVGRGKQEEALKDQVRSMKLSSRVTFYHTVDRILEVLNIIDIGVLTSESEGLSNVLIEYALAGVPAVAFDTGGNNEVILDGQTGFVIPGDDENLMAKKIDHLIKYAQVREEIGQAAKKLAQEKFSIRTMINSMESFYMEIIDDL